MTARRIDGNAISKQIREELSSRRLLLEHGTGIVPRLAVVLVGDDPASQVYVRKKQEACKEVGIASVVYDPVPDFASWKDPQSQIEQQIRSLNENREVHGILVQLPLPKAINPYRVFDLIDPRKDVDVFSPKNVGLLVQGRSHLLPCTPHGIQQMLSRSGIEIAGKKVVVINRSDVVGKPLSSMLIQDNDFANATVTVCHDRTPPETLREYCKAADIVVVAVGKAGFLTGDMISPGAVVVDVGINRVDGKLVGDAAPCVWEVASAVSPVPGGVGPMTVTMLLENTIKAAEFQVWG